MGLLGSPNAWGGGAPTPADHARAARRGRAGTHAFGRGRCGTTSPDALGTTRRAAGPRAVGQLLRPGAVRLRGAGATSCRAPPATPPGRSAPYTTRIDRHPPDRRGRLQRYRAPRLGERDRPVRERRRHDARPRDAHAGGLRLRARQRAVGRAVLHAAPDAEGVGPGALRRHQPPGRRLVVRHVHADRQGVRGAAAGTGGSTPWATSASAPSARCSPPGQSQSGIRLHDYVRGLVAEPSRMPSASSTACSSTATSAAARRSVSPLPIPVLQLLSDFEAVDDGVDPATPRPQPSASGRSPAPRTPTSSSATSPSPATALGR